MSALAVSVPSRLLKCSLLFLKRRLNNYMVNKLTNEYNFVDAVLCFSLRV